MFCKGLFSAYIQTYVTVDFYSLVHNSRHMYQETIYSFSVSTENREPTYITRVKPFPPPSEYFKIKLHHHVIYFYKSSFNQYLLFYTGRLSLLLTLIILLVREDPFLSHRFLLSHLD